MPGPDEHDDPPPEVDGIPDPSEWTPEQIAKLRRIAAEPDPSDN